MNRTIITVSVLVAFTLAGCSSSVSAPATSESRAQLKQSAVALDVDDTATHAKGRHGRSAMARERILK